MNKNLNLFESYKRNLNESINLPGSAESLGNGTKGENYNPAEDACKLNAVKAYLNDNSEEIYAGSVKVDGNEIAHFFNVKGGEVIDHSGTAQKHEMSDYKGVPISKPLTNKGFKISPKESQYCRFENENGDVVECGNFGNKLYFKLNGEEISYEDLMSRNINEAVMNIFESYKKSLLEASYEEERLVKIIEFIKKALGKSLDKENYKDKSLAQLNEIYKKYKDEFNKSGIVKYTVYVLAYNEETNVGTNGYISDNNSLGESYQAALFDSEEEANKALEAFKENSKNKGYSVEKSEVSQLKV